MSIYFYENASYIKTSLLYKKLKLDFEFDTENNLLDIVKPEILPKKTLVKYDIDGVTYKEIVCLEGDDKCVFSFKNLQKNNKRTCK